jgi:hypothetical protein
MPRYLITQRSYLGGRIVQKGETVELAADVIPGEHMIPLDAPPPLPAPPAGSNVSAAPIAGIGLAAPPPAFATSPDAPGESSAERYLKSARELREAAQAAAAQVPGANVLGPPKTE